MGYVTWQFQEERRLKWSLLRTKIYSGDLFHVTCFERQGAHRPHTEWLRAASCTDRPRTRAPLPDLLGLPRQLCLYPLMLPTMGISCIFVSRWSVTFRGKCNSEIRVFWVTCYSHTVFYRRNGYTTSFLDKFNTVWLIMMVPVTKICGACERGAKQPHQWPSYSFISMATVSLSLDTQDFLPSCRAPTRQVSHQKSPITTPRHEAKRPFSLSHFLFIHPLPFLLDPQRGVEGTYKKGQICHLSVLKQRGSNGAKLMMINIRVEIPWGHQPGASRQPQQKGKHWQEMATCFSWSEMTKNKITPWRKPSAQLAKATSLECPLLVHAQHTSHHRLMSSLFP